MTPREGFRFGFYYRCAEEGLDVTQARERAQRGLEKIAEKGWFDRVTGGLGSVAGTAWDATKGLSGLALLGGVGGSALLGGGIGYGLAEAQEKDLDPDEIRQQELISAFRFHADQARRRALMRGIRPPKP